MAAVLDLVLSWEVSGECILLWHTSNEYISGEKALLTFLSNLCHYFLGLHGVTHMRILVRKCEQHKTSKNYKFGMIKVICIKLGPGKWYFLVLDRGYLS